MPFALEDRLLKLAQKLVFHEAPANEKVTGRRIVAAGTRKNLDPNERRADQTADRALAALQGDQAGPQPVNRATQLIDNPGGTAVPVNTWRRTNNAQAATAAPVAPDMAAKLGGALGRDVSDVHIHTDGVADEICRGANAMVVARGRDIFFRRTTAMPGTKKGDDLLTHAIEQVGVDARKADSDRPMRRFVDHEKSTRPDRAVTEEPKKSGRGLLGLVGAALAAKQTYDSFTGDDVDPDAADGDAATESLSDLDEAPAAPGQLPSVDLDAGEQELGTQERKVSELIRASEEQHRDKERLPDHEVVQSQRETLDEVTTTAHELLGEIREARSLKQQAFASFGLLGLGGRGDDTREVAAELGLDAPLQVAANYEAVYRGDRQSEDPSDTDVLDHRLLMEVGVENPGQRFEGAGFSDDIGVTVDRVVNMIDAQLMDEINGVSGAERQRLLADVDTLKPQLPDVIEQRVREAAESNGSPEQEELQLELQQDMESPDDAQDQRDGDTFAFGARIDLRSGEVVVTTNDRIPTSTDAAPDAAAPTTTGGDGGGGGSDGSGGGSGGAPAA